MLGDRINRRCTTCKRYRMISDYRETVHDGLVCVSCAPQAHDAALAKEVRQQAAEDGDPT